MISTHVLDVGSGVPAKAVAVVLEIRQGSDWIRMADGKTDDRGRIDSFGSKAAAGVYRLTFDTGGYHRQRSVLSFFPEVQVIFTIRDANEHVHVPLLLSPFGYTTYKGA